MVMVHHGEVETSVPEMEQPEQDDTQDDQAGNEDEPEEK